MADLEQQGYTVKDWLQRIDAKQDKLDEKIDNVASSMDRKADDRDLRALRDRVLVTEQQNAARMDAWNRMEKKVDASLQAQEDLKLNKADRTELSTLWRLLLSALTGSAIAILAWALTVFAGKG